MSDWAKWWFLNGGGIHKAWKGRNWSYLRGLAETLPKAAWNTQQQRIEKLEAKVKVMRDGIKEIWRGATLNSEEYEKERVNTELVHLLDDICVSCSETLAKVAEMDK
jgi:hypothetical protein